MWPLIAILYADFAAAAAFLREGAAFSKMYRALLRLTLVFDLGSPASTELHQAVPFILNHER
jgi:hypothetical protein